MRHLFAATLIALSSSAAAQDVAVFSEGMRLSGTYLSPDSPNAAALIIAGSGPTDRNGNAPGGLNTNSYAMLASGLERAGIANLRADKRGIGGSTGDGNAVTLSDYASDAGLWIKALRQRTGLNCVWLVGHSEGGLVALHTATGRDDVCGLVLLATPGRDFDEILLEQLAASPAFGAQMPAIRAFLARLKQGEAVAQSDIPAAIAPMFPVAVHGYLTELLQFDPRVAAQSTPLPTLVVQGGQDLQTSPQDAQNLIAALGDGHLLFIDHMTHTLKTISEPTQTANIATYTDPTIPLATGLVNAIASFIGGAP